ncbi:MAG: hypothetical protein GY938_13960 [Ketobacter sp.]|nr:hypothetical protein [Ketobacter sp.]
MAIVGALLHAEPKVSQAVQKHLSGFDNVEVHPLESPGQMALIIESKDINQAHHLITNSIGTTEGVLTVYPVYAHLDDIENS